MIVFRPFRFQLQTFPFPNNFSQAGLPQHCQYLEHLNSTSTCPSFECLFFMDENFQELNINFHESFLTCCDSIEQNFRPFHSEVSVQSSFPGPRSNLKPQAHYRLSIALSHCRNLALSCQSRNPPGSFSSFDTSTERERSQTSTRLS